MGRRKGTTKKDVCWSYCTRIGESRMHVRCNYCEKEMWGGVARLKHHFAGSRKDVPPCDKCPENLKETYKKWVNKGRVREEERDVEIVENEREEGQSVDKRRRSTMDGFVVRTDGSSNAKRRLKQMTMNTMAKSRKPACKAIMNCIYGCHLPLTLVKNPLFKEMIEECCKYGVGLKVPTVHEARVTFLKDAVEDVHSILAKYKEEWAITGCTLMSDGWTDGKNRSITNFLVNSPMGTVFLKSIDSSGDFKDAEKLFSLLDGVVEEIGEENVVQVVTDSAPAYVGAGKLLMEKRKRLFWNPCAAHVMDLILEDIGKLPTFMDVIDKAKRVCNYINNHIWVLNLFRQQKGQRELKKPGITRFATCFLCLESFERNKVCLKAMFGGRKWLESSFASTPEGMTVMDIINRDNNFWKQVKYCLTATEPLVKVLKLVDGDAKPAMGYIYEAMDRAKEQIASSFDKTTSRYREIWEIIDLRWELQLHRPLHAAGYYLNPKFHYSPNFNADDEVLGGVIETIERMYPNPATRFKIESQLEKFKRAEGSFGTNMAIFARDKKQPAHWWATHGSGQELKEFAIRVLSLTCSATGCERNWSTFQDVHSKKRSKMEHERLNNIVFVKYNIRLEMRKKEREAKGDNYNPIELSDMESDNEWITENATPLENGENIEDYEDHVSHENQAPIAPDFSWKDISDLFTEVEVGSSSKKRKRGPRDLRIKKKKDVVQGRGKMRIEVQEDSEPEFHEEELETDESEESLHLDDGSDDSGGASSSNDSDDD